jgi:hypothetical protein
MPVAEKHGRGAGFDVWQAQICALPEPSPHFLDSNAFQSHDFVCGIP